MRLNLYDLKKSEKSHQKFHPYWINRELGKCEFDPPDVSFERS